MNANTTTDAADTTGLSLSADHVAGRVVVAMSGGVDSSVVAAALHDAGEDVVGISMRLYATPAAAGKSCCSPDDLYDAREVAAERGFPFYVANYQELFKQRVMDYFVDEYRRGRTPSPCILCNDHLKFDVLLDRMTRLGGASLATGHYARIEDRGDRFALLRGVDRTKDQSYFLFGLQRSDLARIQFPLGDKTKAEVREMAVALGLVTADKPESQDICFIGSGHYADFVEERLSPEDLRPGSIVRESTGETLGTHSGVHRFTVGQRRGLGIAAEAPLYVKSVDAATGTVFVGTKDEVAMRTFQLDRCNWLRWDVPPDRFEAQVQVRYRHNASDALVAVDPDDPARATVTLAAGEGGIAPGQAAVLYDDDEVLGGGWIASVDA